MLATLAAAALWAAAPAGAQVRLAPAAPLAAPALRPAAPLLSASAVPLSAVRVLGPAVPAAVSAPAVTLAAKTELPQLVAGSARFWDGGRTNLEEAVGRGLTVAAPLPQEKGELGALQRLAAPYRTADQLSKLSQTPRAEGERFSFAVIGDAEPGRFWFNRALFNRAPGMFWRLLARADRSGADFVLQLGDMVSCGLIRQFWSFFRELGTLGLTKPFLTVIGNHDRRSPHGVSDDKVYRAAFGGTDYLFDRGGWRFIVADSSDGRLSRAQLDWLARSIENGAKTLVFTHIPPAPLGEFSDYAGLKGSGGFKPGAAEFMALMREKGVARVYHGHVHALAVADRGPTRYILTGGGGSPLYPVGRGKRALHHYLVVELGPEGPVETVHAADGSSFRL